MPTPEQAIVLRDTTLREGVQIPGSRVATIDQQRFVELLDELGVPEIEIGLPDGVNACADLSRFIHQHGLCIKPTGLVPCYGVRWRQQVDLAAECGLRIDVLAPVSDYLLRETDDYRLTAEQILPRLAEVLAYARSRGIPAGAALMDACRAPRQRLLELLANLDADRVVIYDSVGTMLPWRMSELMRAVRQVTSLPILVHCHNDLGMATANTLAALDAGAAAADVAVNGLGGRAGNAALEEVVMALEQLCGRSPGVNTRRLRELSAFVEQMTGIKNSPLKPVVGRYCFAHVPVMHIRCIGGGNPDAFEPFDPQLVGADRTYGFCLPVDYAAGLEPFLRKCAVQLGPEQMTALLEQLRNEPDKTEEQILHCIHDIASHELCR
jgi:isopropylmalate/homocitrate/citramalate synthase